MAPVSDGRVFSPNRRRNYATRTPPRIGVQKTKTKKWPTGNGNPVALQRVRESEPIKKRVSLSTGKEKPEGFALFCLWTCREDADRGAGGGGGADWRQCQREGGEGACRTYAVVVCLREAWGYRSEVGRMSLLWPPVPVPLRPTDAEPGCTQGKARLRRCRSSSLQLPGHGFGNSPQPLMLPVEAVDT